MTTEVWPSDADVQPPPVENIKTAYSYDAGKGIIGAPKTAVYVGRGMPSIAKSPFVNTIKIKKDTPAARIDAISRWMQWFLDAGKSRLLPALRGASLLCWCKPEICHGDALSWLVTQMRCHGQPCPKCAAPVWSSLHLHHVWGLYETWNCGDCRLRGFRQRTIWTPEKQEERSPPELLPIAETAKT